MVAPVYTGGTGTSSSFYPGSAAWRREEEERRQPDLLSLGGFFRYSSSLSPSLGVSVDIFSLSAYIKNVTRP